MDELHGKDLKTAYWINTHRQEVAAALRLGGIIIISIIWLVFFLYLFGYIRNYSRTERALSGAGDISINYNSIQAPENLIILGRDATAHSDNTIDAYAIIQNPNKFYAGRFSYSFTIAGVSKTFDTGIIMPDEITYLVVNNITAPATASVEVKIEEVDWQRVRGTKIKTDFQVLALQLDTIELAAVSPVEETADATTTNSAVPTEITEEEFVVPSTETTLVEPPAGEVFSQLTASLTNASAYGFRRLRVMAILRDQQKQIIAIQQSVWNDIDSFTTFPVEFNWLHRYPFDAQAELIIQTDIWDEANLIFPGDN